MQFFDRIRRPFRFVSERITLPLLFESIILSMVICAPSCITVIVIDWVMCCMYYDVCQLSKYIVSLDGDDEVKLFWYTAIATLPLLSMVIIISRLLQSAGPDIDVANVTTSNRIFNYPFPSKRGAWKTGVFLLHTSRFFAQSEQNETLRNFF